MSNMRRLVKSTAASVIHGLSLDRLAAAFRGTRKQPLIICYHRVVENFADTSNRAMPSLLVSNTMFEKHLDWLARHYTLVSIDEIHAPGNERQARSGKQLATITFDDGYADFYWNAFPILKRKGIPATVFVVTDLVGTKGLQTHDELYLLLSHLLKDSNQTALADGNALTKQLQRILVSERDPLNATRSALRHFSHSEIAALMPLLRTRVTLPEENLKELQALSWSMLRTLTAQGITIGSHTRSHALLPHCDDARVADELRGSRLHLERELGTPINYLAYPDGQFDERIASAAEQAGYTHAYTICSHRSKTFPHFTIPRKVLWEHASTDDAGRFSPSIFSCLVNGVFDRRANCLQDHGRQ